MRVLTTGEAAELLRVCPATIRRMVRRGDLDGATRRSLGRVTIASIERSLSAALDRDVADWLGGNSCAPASPPAGGSQPTAGGLETDYMKSIHSELMRWRAHVMPVAGRSPPSPQGAGVLTHSAGPGITVARVSRGARSPSD
jgi:excisionase family DNA binding protein